MNRRFVPLAGNDCSQGRSSEQKDCSPNQDTDRDAKDQKCQEKTYDEDDQKYFQHCLTQYLQRDVPRFLRIPQCFACDRNFDYESTGLARRRKVKQL